jgi:hypothetical protein
MHTGTIFSHIIQKRFSAEYEDVATDALAYVLESSDAARRGMMKLLKGIIPELPALRFKTQQVKDTIRPDMWGFADTDLRVFVENKFWAGLTDNQPVYYLEQLAKFSQPSVLLVIAPAEREQALWRELILRLDDAGISIAKHEEVAGIAACVATELGPILALTSWTKVLSVLEHEAVDDHGARADLNQLRALCDSADNEAFTPASREQLSDQRTAAFVIQLGAIVQATVELAVTHNVLSITRLRPQSSWQWIGRYIRVAGDRGAGAWIGIHFELWKAHGTTPIWLVFADTEFGRAKEVRRLIEPWAPRNDVLTVPIAGGFAIALDVLAGEEKDRVVHTLVNKLAALARVLEALPPKVLVSEENEGDGVPA